MRENISLKEDITFGCEIEFECNKSIYDIILDNEFKLDFESQSFKTYEAVSPILTINNLESLKYTLDIINESGAFITEEEGAHIHYGASIIKDEYILNMLKLWCISENVIYKFCEGDMDHLRLFVSIFAKRIRPFIYSCIENIDKGGSGICLRHLNKTYGINISNHFYKRPNKDTYEVRVPNGTLNYEIWLNNIDFFGNLLLTSSNPEYIEFINYIFYKDLYLTKNEVQNLVFKSDESKFYFDKQYSKGYCK